jgi:farnesyl-diphosphate farnesyltransferase
LFSPGREAETERVLQVLIARARLHLEAAREYCTTLPRGAFRVRLFCLVPLFLAVSTLQRIARRDAYRKGWVRIKLTRRRVRMTVLLAALVAPSNTLVRSTFRRLGAGSR